MTREHPNILILMSDEHRADVAGFAGNHVVKTPTLDRLAERGVVFRNAYAPSPICMPCRQALMSGRLPKSIGCLGFGDDLPPGSMTFARWFAQHGYRTVCAGKLHHMGPDQMQGWTSRPAGDLEVSGRYLEVDSKAEAMWRFKRRYNKWSYAEEVRRAGPGLSPYAVFDQQWTDTAIHVIDQHFVDSLYEKATPELPILLKVSLLQPHYPFLAPQQLLDYYLDRVEVYDEPSPDHPGLTMGRQVRLGEDVSHDDARRATAAYYAMIETVDQRFAQVLHALEAAGQDLDDWVIVYLSDHGDMLGQHGVWEKTQFFEGSVRVPFLITSPKRFSPGRVDQNVGLCDLFATLCHLAGLPCPDGLDSRSLSPLLSREHTDESVWSGDGDEAVSQYRGNLMIKRGALKYLLFPGIGPEVLFDLDADPSETTDFADQPEYRDRLKGMRSRARELGYEPYSC